MLGAQMKPAGYDTVLRIPVRELVNPSVPRPLLNSLAARKDTAICNHTPTSSELANEAVAKSGAFLTDDADSPESGG